jgi:hypothetical protein
MDLDVMRSTPREEKARLVVRGFELGLTKVNYLIILEFLTSRCEEMTHLIMNNGGL